MVKPLQASRRALRLVFLRSIRYVNLFAQAAFDDKALAKEVADWKSKFFREKDRDGNVIDYHAAVSGKLQLVPNASLRKELEEDYTKMVEAGLLLGDAETFDELMKRCQALQDQVNGRP